jgi:ATP-dependent protease ClpP protease subunit
MYNHKVIYKKQKINPLNKKKTENEEEEGSNEEMVTCDENHIYFYDDVNTKNILTLIKYIKIINAKLLLFKMDMKIKYNMEIDPEIYIHINCYGGYITDALSGVDAIINSKIPITTIVEGAAASAATLLSVVGKKRQITKNASMLIHQLSGENVGTYEQMKDEIANCTYLEEICNKIYLENTKKKLKKKFLNETLKHDLWWNAAKCLRYGFVDEII